MNAKVQRAKEAFKPLEKWDIEPTECTKEELLLFAHCLRELANALTACANDEEALEALKTESA